VTRSGFAAVDKTRRFESFISGENGCLLLKTNVIKNGFAAIAKAKKLVYFINGEIGK
jgi:hypothetical protein